MNAMTADTRQVNHHKWSQMLQGGQDRASW